MTGRNPMHTGLDPMNWTTTIMRGEGCDPPRALAGCDSSLSSEYVFLPRLLRSAGYESAMLGKVRCLAMPSRHVDEVADHSCRALQWHLGSFLQEFTPVGRGFTTSFGFLGGYET